VALVNSIAMRVLWAGDYECPELTREMTNICFGSPVCAAIWILFGILVRSTAMAIDPLDQRRDVCCVPRRNADAEQRSLILEMLAVLIPTAAGSHRNDRPTSALATSHDPHTESML